MKQMTVAQENLMAWAIEEAAKPAAEQPTEDEIMAKTMEMLTPPSLRKTPKL